MLKVNDKAPEFTLLNSENKEISLKDFLGKKVIIYFYPKDNTSGCTKEALGYKELYEEYKKNNVEVIGISKDSVKSHLNFKNKYELPFILLSDESMKVIQAYEAYGEKSLYGKKYMGTIRSTFIVDEKGYLISINKNVNANTNPKDTLYLIGTK